MMEREMKKKKGNRKNCGDRIWIVVFPNDVEGFSRRTKNDVVTIY